LKGLAKHAERDDRGPSQALNFTKSTKLHQAPQQLCKSINALPPYTGDPSTLPPLPPILSESLTLVPFTSPGYLNSSVSSKLHTTYDRLEFLGDAYIEVIATRHIFRLFPNLPAGRLSQHRELCVKNETLSEYAHAYGFDKRARLPVQIHKGERKLWIKTMGDIFEAYVAAIIISNPSTGFQTAEAWLTALWQNKLSPLQSKPAFETQTADPNAKNDLGRKVLSKGIRLNYVEESPPIEIRDQGKRVYHIGVYLTGWGWENQHLGSGTGLNKSEAGAMAAVEAVKNPLTEKINAVKKAYDANLAAERAANGEGESPWKTRAQIKIEKKSVLEEEMEQIKVQKEEALREELEQIRSMKEKALKEEMAQLRMENEGASLQD
jgi:ribonuclease-3